MAVTAIDAIIADMMLVAEWNRLDARDADLGYVRRLVDCRERRQQRDEQDDTSEDAEFGNGVGAGMEYLSHSSSHLRSARHKIEKLNVCEMPVIYEISGFKEKGQTCS